MSVNPEIALPLPQVINGECECGEQGAGNVTRMKARMGVQVGQVGL